MSGRTEHRGALSGSPASPGWPASPAPAGRPDSPDSPDSPARGGYIVGFAYDWAFFLLPPLLSLALGIAISGTDFADAPVRVGAAYDSLAGFFVGTLIHAHLVAVVFRSHGNPALFRAYPLRFTLVPLLVWAAIVASPWVAVAATVVSTFWDVWHSGAQTFGFARIYDRNHGAPPDAGRRLDFWLNQLLYAGPILAGATLLDHTESLEDFRDLGDTFLSAIPAYVQGRQRYLAIAVITGGTLFVVYYLYAYFRLWRRGYRPCFEKVFLLASTGFCSIYTWGFNSWGEAFFIMNLFHGVQYLALVWAAEGDRIARRLRLPRRAALVAYLGLVFAYGFGVEILDPSYTALWAVTIVVSLMHFWYDAFIWSVRKRQI